MLYSKGSDIVARLNDVDKTLYTYPESMNMTVDFSINSIDLTQFNSVNVIGTVIQTVYTGISLCESASKYLTLNITEHQNKTQKWCCAYSAAAIMRTLKFNTSCTAKTIMQYFYSNPTGGNNLSSAQIIKYAKAKSINVKGTSSFSGNQAIAEINAGRPVWYGMTSSLGNHAVVLRGYNASSGTYSIWNPYFDFYETYPASGTYVPVGHSEYRYKLNYAIYNWKK